MPNDSIGIDGGRRFRGRFGQAVDVDSAVVVRDEDLAVRHHGGQNLLKLN